MIQRLVLLGESANAVSPRSGVRCLRAYSAEGYRRTAFVPTGYEELRLMLIRIDDHSLVDNLCAHYRRSGFEAESVGGGVVEVGRAGAPDEEWERREVLMPFMAGEA